MTYIKSGDKHYYAWSYRENIGTVLHFASVQGEYGPGHNSFFCDRNGDWWIAYHAVSSYEEKVISTGIRRVHFDSLNRPRLDLCKEEDLPDIYRIQ